MKKHIRLLSALILLALTLTACESGKWQGDISNLDPGWIQHQYDLIDEAQAVLDENPEDEDALLEIGFRYYELEDYKKAEKYYKKVLEVNPNNMVAITNLASVYEKVEEYELAAENIMIYFQSNQGSSEAVRDAVRILLKNDDPDNAEIALNAFVDSTRDAGSNSAEGYQAFISGLKDDIYNYKVEHGLVQ
jgi:tetratricopeptide (TPR) repeat protein